jgi:flagellar protein FlaG
MRIDGTDASNANHLPVQRQETTVKAVPVVTKEKTNITDSMNLSQLSGMEKRGELPISEKVVIDAIEKANRALSGANRRFEFSIHEKTKQIMVKVIDSDTNEVVREIPPEKILDMIATFWEMSGLFVDERR